MRHHHCIRGYVSAPRTNSVQPAQIPPADPTYNLSYTMWFFSRENPNDATTQRRKAMGLHATGYASTDVCWLAGDNVTKHKAAPTTEYAKACHPFQNHACCQASTVKDVDAMRNAYGSTYRWDRCGKISQECERFFVQEACAYE